ncbi:hypothetical protein [Paraburkholderia terricola]|uniref:hypothetical protein n=1 Tax=Paraburkholderia terricola TaxID=169427 RepID=UPI001FD4157E|nr:hypothetical protein [Paraburkholderia terricola]
MRQSNYKAIDGALDRHKSGTTRHSDGKVTVVNIAREARVGRATVYRCFAEHADLKTKYDQLYTQGASKAVEPPETPHEAFLQARDEIKHLRDELKDVKRQADEQRKMSANMIFVLKRRIEVVETENKNLRTNRSQGTVIQMPRPRQPDDNPDDEAV